MTIAAGFLTSDGALLCADTLYTDGYTKYHREKIFPWSKHGITACFAVAGNATIGKMVVDDCIAKLDSLEGERSFSDVFGTIRKVIQSVQHEYVDKTPIEERDRSRFYLLVAIYTPAAGTRLYASNDAALASVDTYECIGAGRQIALHVLEPSYSKALTIEKMTIIAIQALAAAKERVDGVGGRSQFWTIRNGIVSDVEPYDYDKAETQALEYRQRTANLFSAISDRNLDDKEFESALEWFSDGALSLRANLKGGVAPWRYLAERLARYQVVPQDPLRPTGGLLSQPPLPESPEESDES